MQEWSQVAVKVTRPTVLDLRTGPITTYDDIEQRCQEIKSLCRLQEGSASMSCVLHLYEYFWSSSSPGGKKELYLVTELLGQELDQWQKEQEVFLESTAKRIAKVLLNALQYMHDRGVVHRDIKLQNVLFKRNGDFKTLKIVDFGLAKTLEHGEAASDFCGSLGYIAPEIYQQQPYRYEVDMFAFGVILFRMLSGARPFPFHNQEKLRRDTVDLRYNVQGNNWQGVSQAAIHMVRKLLIGKEERLDVYGAIHHDWFKQRRGEDSVLRVDWSLTQQEETRSQQIVLVRYLASPFVAAYKVSNKVSCFCLPFLQSHAPEALPPREGNRFWLDSSLESALNVLLAEEIYCGRVVDDDGSRETGLICVEEFEPRSSMVLPVYISKMPVFTERECRRLCRDIARCIEVSHASGMAHRNLHMNTVIVDKSVRLVLFV
jgi:serine/threonine protein kinase